MDVQKIESRLKIRGVGGETFFVCVKDCKRNYHTIISFKQASRLLVLFSHHQTR